MRDETSDGGDAGRAPRAAEAGAGGDDARLGREDSRAAGDDELPTAEGEVDLPPGAHEGARAAGPVDSDAAHRRWMAVAAACAVASVVLLITVGVNAAFVAAVLGVVAWFWEQRNRIRAGLIEDETQDEGRDELEEFDEDGGGRDGGERRGDEV